MWPIIASLRFDPGTDPRRLARESIAINLTCFLSILIQSFPSSFLSFAFFFLLFLFFLNQTKWLACLWCILQKYYEPNGDISIVDIQRFGALVFCCCSRFISCLVSVFPHTRARICSEFYSQCFEQHKQRAFMFEQYCAILYSVYIRKYGIICMLNYAPTCVGGFFDVS